MGLFGYDQQRWKRRCGPSRRTRTLHEFSSDAQFSDIHVEDFEKRTRAGDYPAIWPTPLPDSAYCDNWIGWNGLEIMKHFPAGRPWHLAVNFADPHDPEDITARMEKTCRSRNSPPPNGNTQYRPEVHNAIRQNYTAMVENLDRWVGIYLDEMARRARN